MKVGEFEAKATEIELEGAAVVAVWSDGVMLSADCDFKLEPGKRYKVTIEAIEG